jgi:hypothetical protein
MARINSKLPESFLAEAALNFKKADEVDDGVRSAVVSIEGTEPDVTLYYGYDAASAVHDTLINNGIEENDPRYLLYKKILISKMHKNIEGIKEISRDRWEKARSLGKIATRNNLK